MMTFLIALALAIGLPLLVLRILWDGFCEVEKRRRDR
jgi:hypothetical protein